MARHLARIVAGASIGLALSWAVLVVVGTLST
jgi:hypothetical protein